MDKLQQFNAIFEHDGDGFTSLCPQFDIASQGDTAEEEEPTRLRCWSYSLKLPIQLKFRITCEAKYLEQARMSPLVKLKGV
jgi:hypothetical protein